MDDIFNQMLSSYEINTDTDKRNATFEVMQQIILAGLRQGGFFDKAAFYGGTCLRIFHGLQRFSEDMDFSLVRKDDKFNIEDYFEPIVKVFESIGRKVVITKKDKRTFGRVESAFLKDNTQLYDVAFQTEKSIKIKIEVDTNPPLMFDTEQKLLMKPYSFMTRCFTLPDLYAGKMHALVFRNWKTRLKGRDWYDFEWYVRNDVPLDFQHLQERIREFSGEKMSREKFMQLLNERLATADMKSVLEDVTRFVRNPNELKIWSNDYFLELAKKIRFKEATV
ncbi:MAG: nucleotidyl transferase AbiEii/AbiGii toxin family protein [Bacteroidales bacterium]|nr:nucleotidyl transferase AbiEii/AbiGii toxin family protein [Bacteroidales bacterium]MBR4584155.1 nucleotidyl transferase AbiEii/AbiGii toxin family protein [Bacteroidales bacterium]